MTPFRQRRVGADLRRVHPAQLGQVAVLQPRERAVLLRDRGAERRGRQEVVEDRGFDLGVEEEARVPDVGEVVVAHAVGVIGERRAAHSDPHAGNLPAHRSGLFVPGRPALLLLESRGAELLGVRPEQLFEHRDGDAVAVLAVARDLHLRPRHLGRATGGIVHHAADVLEVDLVRKADEVIDDRAVGNHVGRDAALGDHALDAVLGAPRGAQVIHRRIELHRRLQGVAPVPGRELVRGAAAESVLDGVDVEATDPEARPVAARLHRRVAAHQDVGALEHARLPHDVLGGGIDLLGGSTVDDQAARHPGLDHVLHERARSSERDGALGVVLIAVEVALGAAQRVVLGDEAERGARGAGGRRPRRGEGGRQPRDAGVHREPIRPEDRRQRVERLELVPADFGVVADPVRQPLHLAGPHRRHPREQAISSRVGPHGEPLGGLGRLEARLERIDLPQDRRGGFALGVGSLSVGDPGAERQGDGNGEGGDGAAHCESSGIGPGKSRPMA